MKTIFFLQKERHLMYSPVDRNGLWEREKSKRLPRHLFIYLLFMFLRLIEFSPIVPVGGYKSRLSISQDSQKTAAATDAGRRAGRGHKRPRFMFARKNMTLGLCCLSAEHLFHYLEDS